MKTEQPNQSVVFLQTVSVALAQLKLRLQEGCARRYPILRDIIHLVLDEEEVRAWELTSFPHLLLPDLVEAHLASMNLRAAKRERVNVFATQGFDGVEAHVHAAC